MQSTGLLKAAFPGKYIQGENALSSLPDIVRLLGSHGIIIASATSVNNILPHLFNDLEGNLFSVEQFGGECSQKEIQRLSGIIQIKKPDIIIGMGGGKTIDAAKIIADRADLPVIIVPTIASTDAPCSGCAIIYTDDGVFESIYYQRMNPQVVLVDTRIIAEAPVRFLVAGMGDALATWFEARSCDRTQSPNECGGHSTMTGLNLARLCYDILIKYGLSAKMACENKLITPALDHIIEANILLSGIGFESSGLATAHSVHNGLSALPETHVYYHGEKVAIGVLTGLHLTDAMPDEIDAVYSFCETLGLPTTLADIGIHSAEKNRLMEVAVKACAPAEGIYHEALQITPEKLYDAIVMADSMGRMRKPG